MNDAGANNKNGLLEKGRSGVLHVIFGRSAVVLVLILIQLILMFWVFDYFRKSVPYFFGGLNCSNFCGQYKKRSYEDNI